MNNTLEGINSRGRRTDNDLEDRMVEITATEQSIQKRVKRNEDSLRDLWDNIRHKTCIIGVLEGEETGTGSEKILRNNR